MDIKIVDKLKEILRDEDEFKIYNEMLMEFLFSDRLVVRLRDKNGNTQIWRRSTRNNKFERDKSPYV